jgi:arginine exporter protein ArgO
MVEAKVWAATAAAAVTAFIVWLADTYLFVEGSAGGDAVPEPVETFIQIAVVAGFTFLGGYMARHTSRPPEP